MDDKFIVNTDTDISTYTATDNFITQDTILDYQKKEETKVEIEKMEKKVQEREIELNKKIEKLSKKLANQKTRYDKKAKLYEARIKELENRKWKYKVGDIVLYDGWRQVRITELVDYCDWLYSGVFLDIENPQTISFKQEELSKYNAYEYERKLIDKIWELKQKLKERS